MGWSLLKKDVMESWIEPAYVTSFLIFNNDALLIIQLRTSVRKNRNLFPNLTHLM